MKQFLCLIAMLAFSTLSFGSDVTQRDLGAAKIIERVFKVDFEACEKDFKNFLCVVNQFKGDRSQLGLILDASNPRCFYEDEEGKDKVIVAIDLHKRGYMVTVTGRGRSNPRGSAAKRYIKKCFDSLEEDAIKLLVVSRPI